MMVKTRRFWLRVRRSIVAAATLAAVAACAVGVPVPSALRKTSAERFPCENHPCGCVDAAACWQDCCCMTDAAKLAWAERAGVTPPAFVVARAAKAVTSHDDACLAVAGGSCCGSESEECCAAAKACCSEAAAAKPAADVPVEGAGFVMLHAAMKCRGLSVSVAVLPPSLPVVAAEFFPPLAVRFEPRVVGPSQYEAPCRSIPTPPPQRALA